MSVGGGRGVIGCIDLLTVRSAILALARFLLLLINKMDSDSDEDKGAVSSIVFLISAGEIHRKSAREIESFGKRAGSAGDMNLARIMVFFACYRTVTKRHTEIFYGWTKQHSRCCCIKWRFDYQRRH